MCICTPERRTPIFPNCRPKTAPTDTSSAPCSPDTSTEIAKEILKHWDVGRCQSGGCSTHWIDPDHDFDPQEVEKLAETIRPIIKKANRDLY